MKEMTATRWQRSGSSLIWSPALLAPLITEADAVSLRAVLDWASDGFPESPPAGRSTVLVGGLQTVLWTASSPEAAYDWLRQNILPLIRAFQSHWDQVGLVFGMDGPARLFEYNVADDLVYFGRDAQRARRVKLSLGIWNGAATGDGAFELLVPGTTEVGGYYVQRVS